MIPGEIVWSRTKLPRTARGEWEPAYTAKVSGVVVGKVQKAGGRWSWSYRPPSSAKVTEMDFARTMTLGKAAVEDAHKRRRKACGLDKPEPSEGLTTEKTGPASEHGQDLSAVADRVRDDVPRCSEVPQGEGLGDLPWNPKS